MDSRASGVEAGTSRLAIAHVREACISVVMVEIEADGFSIYFASRISSILWETEPEGCKKGRKHQGWLLLDCDCHTRYVT